MGDRFGDIDRPGSGRGIAGGGPSGFKPSFREEGIKILGAEVSKCEMSSWAVLVRRRVSRWSFGDVLDERRFLEKAVGRGV